MLYTKTEFAKNVLDVEPPRLSALINKKKIVANKDGKIDDENKVNAKYLIERQGNIKKFEAPKGRYDGVNPDEVYEAQSGKEKLETQLLEERISKEKSANILISLKLAKDKKEIVETELLNKIIIGSFDSLFKTILEYPNNIADELIDIVKTSESPRTDIIQILTLGIGELLKKSLSEAEKEMLRLHG